jgi:flagellar biosynthesis protein FlhA
MADEAAEGGSIFTRFNQNENKGQILMSAGILFILSAMLFPVPTWLLDTLLSISITLSLLILLNVLFIGKALEFNSFPTVLLIAALLRLSLNVATTRTILSHGHEGPSAAGSVIETFGSLVIGGNVLIGAIVFIILTLVNFIVITKGSGRIAEVSARFSLDAMPGKQMAIDADLSAGLIDEKSAKSRRRELEQESTFFGAMDGASKFVRGDAVAGIIITFINFVAGIVIGVVQKDMPFAEAAASYTTLTIGDGLVSQIPSLIVSTSAGLLVSKSATTGSADKAVFGQLGRFPQALTVAAIICTALAVAPGLPILPFATLAAFLGYMGWKLGKNPIIQADERQDMIDEQKVEESKVQKEAEEAPEEPIEQTLQIDNVRLELGYALLPLINYGKGQKLTDQIKALRKQMAKDLGFVMPAIRIQDNMQLPANTYIIKVKEIECGRGEARPDSLLVMDPRGGKIELPGEDTTEPTFGLPAKWVPESSREEALFKNYTVVPPPTVITTHITEIVKESISELLSYSEVQKLIDGLPEVNKKLVEDTIPSQISISSLQRILQNLLKELVSVRDLPTILEATAEATKMTQSLTMITEHVRARLARQISHANTNDAGEVTIVSLSPKWEQAFAESLVGPGEEKQLAMPPSTLQEFIKEVRANFENHAMRGELPVLLTSPNIRPYVRAVIERFRPSTVIMSQNEIHPKAKLKNVGQV